MSLLYMSLLYMSLSASILIVVILLLRQLLLKKLPKTTFIILWVVVLIRLLIPYQLPSSLSFYNLILKTNIETLITPTRIHLPTSFTQFPVKNTEITLPFGITLKSILLIIWIIGLGITALYYIKNYKRSLIYFSDSYYYIDSYIEKWKKSHHLKRKIRIKMCDYITSPLTYRIFSPVILFPISFNFEDTQTMKFVLEHEYQHIKHFDQLLKYFIIVATCIHWFNPFVWLMFFISNRDIEARCDEKVLQSLGMNYKKQYATILVDLEEKQDLNQKVYSSFNKAPLDERILLIMKYQRFSMIRSLYSIALTGMIIAIFATTIQIKLITINNEPILAPVSQARGIDIPLTNHNARILYEDILKDPFQENFTLSIKDGEYLCIALVNHAPETVSYVVTMEAVDQFGRKSFWREFTSYDSANDEFGPYSNYLTLNLLNNKKGFTNFKIQIGDSSNKQMNAEVKIMHVKDMNVL